MLDKSEGVVIALGYFDSVHLGHRKVIEHATSLAKELNAKPVVFTFSGNLKGAINGASDTSIYTIEERVAILKEIGIEKVYSAPVTKEFLNLSASQFLEKLNSDLNIKGYATGSDYRFGCKGQGDIESLKEYASKKGQVVVVTQTEMVKGEKVSTSLIKKLLTQGDIQTANTLLVRNYSITGQVYKDRKVGEKLGFPTVNLKMDIDKHEIKPAVYYGRVFVDGVYYKAIINYGARPTFSLKEKVLEAHLINFNGDLYGKTLTVFFDGFLREIKTFSNGEELKSQLKKDLIKAMESI